MLNDLGSSFQVDFVTIWKKRGVAAPINIAKPSLILRSFTAKYGFPTNCFNTFKNDPYYKIDRNIKIKSNFGYLSQKSFDLLTFEDCEPRSFDLICSKCRKIEFIRSPGILKLHDFTKSNNLDKLYIEQNIADEGLPEEIALIPSQNLRNIDIKTELLVQVQITKLLGIIEQLASFQTVVTVRTECAVVDVQEPKEISSMSTLSSLMKPSEDTFNLDLQRFSDNYTVLTYTHTDERSRKKLVIITQKVVLEF